MPTHDPASLIGRVRDNNGAVEALFSGKVVPVPSEHPIGSIVEVSGDVATLVAAPGSALDRVYALLARFGLDPLPAAGVSAEVDDILDLPGLDDAVTDRTDLPFVTIDNEGSRDLDQAMFIARESDGFAVYYALADASYYVRPDTRVFEAALERGSSFYVPGLAVPMLPRQLSEGLVSLNPDVDRRALVTITRLDPDGHIRGTEVERARIRSRAQLTYGGVQSFFDAAAESPPTDAAHWEWLPLLKDVGERRMALATERGIIRFERAEASVRIVDAQAPDFVVEMRERLDVERWNEQISLLCNMEGARLLGVHGRNNADLHSIYRVHLPPLSKRLARLEATIADIVEAQGLDPVWRWRRGHDLARYLGNLPREARTERVRRAVSRQVQYANRASEFSEIAGPHYALHAERYARFSSPMREIVGIFTHKELLEGMGLVAPRDRVADEALRTRVIDSGNAAKRLQRQLDKEVGLMAIEQLLETDLAVGYDDRSRRFGTVMGVRKSRLYVSLDDFPVDLKVYTNSIERRYGCRYRAESAALVPTDSSAPSFAVGDGVDVVALGYDEKRRRFDLEVSPQAGSAPQAPAGEGG